MCNFRCALLLTSVYLSTVGVAALTTRIFIHITPITRIEDHNRAHLKAEEGLHIYSEARQI